MTQRQHVPFHPTIVIGSSEDHAAIHRVARQIFRRHIREGDRITWEQAKLDAERAWWEVQSMKKSEVAA